jgi:hypothetical protein
MRCDETRSKIDKSVVENFGMNGEPAFSRRPVGRQQLKMFTEFLVVQFSTVVSGDQFSWTSTRTHLSCRCGLQNSAADNILVAVGRRSLLMLLRLLLLQRLTTLPSNTAKHRRADELRRLHDDDAAPCRNATSRRRVIQDRLRRRCLKRLLSASLRLNTYRGLQPDGRILPLLVMLHTVKV